MGQGSAMQTCAETQQEIPYLSVIFLLPFVDRDSAFIIFILLLLFFNNALHDGFRTFRACSSFTPVKAKPKTDSLSKTRKLLS